MIEVEKLSYTYPKQGTPTIKDISFSIKPGEIFGFLGPSGSGKTTTQKILYKLLHGYSGKIEINQKSLQSRGRDFYEKIGVSFELPNHYLKLTARENLRFFASFYSRPPKDFDTLLNFVGLQQDADKPVGDFSKGMKMRLNFIRALVHDPQILFLDEPTSGLDPVNANVIKKLILQLKQEGKLIFLTTHNMFDADQLCDQVALLHQGQIKALDNPAALKLKYGKKLVEVRLEGSNTPHEFELEGIGRNAEFLSLIKNENVATIHSQEATLEDAFLAITGKTLQ